MIQFTLPFWKIDWQSHNKLNQLPSGRRLAGGGLFTAS